MQTAPGRFPHFRTPESDCSQLFVDTQYRGMIGKWCTGISVTVRLSDIYIYIYVYILTYISHIHTYTYTCTCTCTCTYTCTYTTRTGMVFCTKIYHCLPSIIQCGLGINTILYIFSLEVNQWPLNYPMSINPKNNHQETTWSKLMISKAHDICKVCKNMAFVSQNATSRWTIDLSNSTLSQWHVICNWKYGKVLLWAKSSY